MERPAAGSARIHVFITAAKGNVPVLFSISSIPEEDVFTGAAVCGLQQRGTRPTGSLGAA